MQKIKKPVALFLVLMTIFCACSALVMTASAATWIAPGSSYPSKVTSSTSCTVKLSSNKQASVYVWAYGTVKNAAVNIRMLDGTSKKVIWSENSAFKCSKVYYYAFYQGGRTFYLGADHSSYILQFSCKNTVALYVRNPSKCTIS